MNQELVSVIMPSYRSERFIAEAIESVRSQSYPHWELLVIDDCSPDNANAIVASYAARDRRITLIKLERNGGAAVARNAGIEAAKGRYIAFLDSDDVWLPHKLEVQLALMQSKNLAFTYGSYEVIDETSQRIGTFRTKLHITYESMLKTCSVGCLTAMYDTHRLGKMYMPSIRKRQDYALWLAILKRINEAQGIMEPIALYRKVKGSISSNKLDAARYQWRIYREVEQLDLWHSFYYFAHYAYNGMIKYKGEV